MKLTKELTAYLISGGITTERTDRLPHKRRHHHRSQLFPVRGAFIPASSLACCQQRCLGRRSAHRVSPEPALGIPFGKSYNKRTGILCGSALSHTARGKRPSLAVY